MVHAQPNYHRDVEVAAVLVTTSGLQLVVSVALVRWSVARAIVLHAVSEKITIDNSGNSPAAVEAVVDDGA